METSIPEMDAHEFRLWEAVRISPARWILHPWADDLDGFWVVGLIGESVIWYNEIEDGFNVSRYRVFGEIAEYWCDQAELVHVIRNLHGTLNAAPAAR